jgi:Leucine-rich repeat (LRR) protein
LSEIPEEITNLKFLNTLRIHNNQISEIPKSVSDYLDSLSNYKF